MADLSVVFDRRFGKIPLPGAFYWRTPLIPAALLATRAVASMLYGIRADDPVTLAGMTVTLLLVSGVAGYFPARRASRVDPMSALRAE